MAVIASRSFLVGALLRHAVSSHRHSVFLFLRGLSQGELECLADFQGALILEAESDALNPYRLMEEFFHPEQTGSWQTSSDRTDKAFIVLTYLDHFHYSTLPLNHPAELNAA